jgi:hypothetical protein
VHLLASWEHICAQRKKKKSKCWILHAHNLVKFWNSEQIAKFSLHVNQRKKKKKSNKTKRENCIDLEAKFISESSTTNVKIALMLHALECHEPQVRSSTKFWQCYIDLEAKFGSKFQCASGVLFLKSS